MCEYASACISEPFHINKLLCNQVVDVNDCWPRFSTTSYSAVVAENSEVGATVTVLTATDDDEGSNGQVSLKQMSFISHCVDARCLTLDLHKF